MSRQPLTLLPVWPQGGAGVGAPGPAAASDAQRTGEHAAGQGHAHHHQVKDREKAPPPDCIGALGPQEEEEFFFSCFTVDFNYDF